MNNEKESFSCFTLVVTGSMLGHILAPFRKICNLSNQKYPSVSTSLPVQVLELLEKPGGLSAQLHEVHHQPAVPPISLHRGLCSLGHAALWGPVSVLLPSCSLPTSYTSPSFDYKSSFIYRFCPHILTPPPKTKFSVAIGLI